MWLRTILSPKRVDIYLTIITKLPIFESLVCFVNCVRYFVLFCLICSIPPPCQVNRKGCPFAEESILGEMKEHLSGELACQWEECTAALDGPAPLLSCHVSQWTLLLKEAGNPLPNKFRSIFYMTGAPLLALFSQSRICFKNFIQ